MIKSELLDKGSMCHAFLISPTHPEILIPVKGVIEDFLLKEDIPIYRIKVVEFYDDFNFLLRNLYPPRRFYISKTYSSTANEIRLSKKITNRDQLANFFNGQSTIRFNVESTFVCKNKTELFKLFDRINEFLVCKYLKQIKDTIVRPKYDGPLHISGEREFHVRMERGFSDLFNSKQEFDDFINLIENKKHST